MDLSSYLLEEDFELFCREAYENVVRACDHLGIINDDNYESFKARYESTLEVEYINSIENLTIH
jgi:hypothetical protein